MPSLSDTAASRYLFGQDVAGNCHSIVFSEVMTLGFGEDRGPDLLPRTPRSDHLMGKAGDGAALLGSGVFGRRT
jgi:hypothetical protein